MVKDKGLLWEMIKMEIRAATIHLSKRKARQKAREKVIRRIQSSSRANPYKL